MKLASNVEVLSVTPVHEGRELVLLLKDRNDDREYFYKMHSMNIPNLTATVLLEGLFESK